MTTPKFKNFNIEPYKPGKSKIKKLKKIIKLSAKDEPIPEEIPLKSPKPFLLISIIVLLFL